MPGPNNKKKRKAQSKNKNKNVLQTVQPDARPPTPTASRHSPSLPSTELPTPLSISNEHPIDSLLDQQQDKSYPYLPQSELLLLEKPFIYDPGNGPRVRDTRAFLASKFFAQPPAWDVRTYSHATPPTIRCNQTCVGSIMCRICTKRST